MFTHIRSAHRLAPSQTTVARALAAAFALAAVVTTMLTPAHAQTLTFQPDVRVNYIGRSYNNGKYIYRFRVENIGAASADNVYVDKAVHQVSLNGKIAADQAVGGQNIAYLGTDQSVDVKVTCIPLPGYVCAGASATANVPDDLDPSNNHAHS